MSTPMEITNDRRAVSICSSEDRSALMDLYLAVCPNGQSSDLDASFSSGNALWFGLKDDRGRIVMAMLAAADGGVLLLANPSDLQSRETREGFLALAEETFRTVQSPRVRSLTVMLPKGLRKLGDILERSGLLGEETMSVREMQFTDSAEVSGPRLVRTAVPERSEDLSGLSWLSSWFDIFSTKESL